MTTLLRRYREGLRVGWADFREIWSLQSWMFGWMLRIVTNAFAWVLVGRILGSEQKLQFLLVGNALAAGASAALWASNATTWMRYDGIHTLLVAAPGSMLPAVVGRSSVWLLNGIATSTTTFLLLFALFGFRPPLERALWLLPLIVLVCSSTFAFATFLGALIGRHLQLRNFVLDITGTLFMAFCGVSVPLSFWPEPLRLVAQLLPLTHGLRATRLLLEGAASSALWSAVGRELLVGGAWLVVSLLTLDRLAEAGRADGSIELA